MRQLSAPGDFRYTVYNHEKMGQSHFYEIFSHYPYRLKQNYRKPNVVIELIAIIHIDIQW